MTDHYQRCYYMTAEKPRIKNNQRQNAIGKDRKGFQYWVDKWLTPIIAIPIGLVLILFCVFMLVFVKFFEWVTEAWEKI